MTTHAHPRPGQTVTACCLTAVTALPIGDRLTLHPDRVTCGREGASDARYGVQNATGAAAWGIGRSDEEGGL